MGLHGTDPLEGLEVGSKEYLQVKKRLAEEDLESREGEIRVTETDIRNAKKFLGHDLRTIFFAATVAVAAGCSSYILLFPEGTVEARAETTCTDLAKKSQTPPTPESLSLCGQYARESIQRKDFGDQIAGGAAGLLAMGGLLFAGLRVRECVSDIEELIQRRRKLEEYQSQASETREEIKGLDKQLASLKLG